jgi:hypothetical protein
MISFVFIFLPRKSQSEASEKVFQLCERAFRSRLTLRKEGQVELRGRRLTDLARVRLWQRATESVNAIFYNGGFHKRPQPFQRRHLSARLSGDQTYRELVYHPLQFQKRGQYFIRPHNEPLSVAMRVSNPDCSSCTPIANCGVDLISDALPFGRLWYAGPMRSATPDYAKSTVDHLMRSFAFTITLAM